MEQVYHWVGLIVVWAAAFVALIFICAYLIKWTLMLYRKTWLSDYIDILRMIWFYDIRKSRTPVQRGINWVRENMEAKRQAGKFVPGYKWWTKFLNRWEAVLSERKANNPNTEDDEE